MRLEVRAVTPFPSRGADRRASPQQITVFSFRRPQDQTGTTDSEYTLVKPFGSCSDDVCYDQDQADFIAAVDTLSASGGGDTPESQTIALVRAAEDWSWRDGVLKVRRRAHLHVRGTWPDANHIYLA